MYVSSSRASLPLSNKGHGILLAIGQPALEAIGLEGPPFEHAVVYVDVDDQVILDVRPALPESRQHLCIDRRAVVFHGGGGGHVAAPQERPRQVDPRRHGGQQALQGDDVALAIVKDFHLV